ncbi:restriction endonuclease [Flagellimonas baculiformis]|uniref:restriction endonuclease n=1 Tax=Flagellimonas baculiformis TaxID=3067310 RepID=UPI00296EF87D|nr:restriction endonuclease [Muricauda sp. D6]
MEKRIKVFDDYHELVPFSMEKLADSIKVIGLPEPKQQFVLNQVKSILYDGIPVEEIFEYVFKLLKEEGSSSAAKYKLKRALFELGPTGYPFENYIGAILTQMGFNTDVGVILPGKCVNHEVDVMATKEGKAFIVECKFHSSDERKSNVKAPLYIKARFDDVRDTWNNKDVEIIGGWLITNTCFTEDAIAYANCENLMLLSWDYPKKRGLRAMIDLFKMYPVTCSTILSKKEKQELINRNIVLCKDVVDNPKVLNQFRISMDKKQQVIDEFKEIVTHNG